MEIFASSAGRAAALNEYREASKSRSHRGLGVQADSAYNAGNMQYTLRNIPSDLDQALRETAHDQRKSLNQVAVEALQRAVGLTKKRGKRRDLADIAGTWKEDSRFDAALADQRRIDPEMWE